MCWGVCRIEAGEGEAMGGEESSRELGLQRLHITANTPRQCSIALLAMPVQKHKVRLVPVPCSGGVCVCVSCCEQPPREGPCPCEAAPALAPALHRQESPTAGGFNRAVKTRGFFVRQFI